MVSCTYASEKLSSKFTDLKQVHADGIHVILIFQKDIKITTEAGKRLFNPIAILQNVRQNLRVAVRKLIQQHPILSQIFEEGFVFVVLERAGCYNVDALF